MSRDNLKRVESVGENCVNINLMISEFFGTGDVKGKLFEQSHNLQ